MDLASNTLDRRTFVNRSVGYSALGLAAPTALITSADAQTSPRPSLTGQMSGFNYLRGQQRAPHAWFIDGNQNSMTTDKWMGKPIVMVFWQQDCSYCLRDMPRLNAAYGRLTSMGVKVIPMTIGPEKLTRQVQAHYKQRGYDKLPIYTDAAAEMQVGYDVRGTPTWYVIDKRGYVVGYLERPIDWGTSEAQTFIKAFL